jgi:hypothetical protein
MSGLNAELTTLREAAVRRDWGDLQAGLTRILLDLDYFTGLEIAVTRVHEYLPTFEAAHPQALWARRLLVGLVAYGMAPAELPPEASQPHNSPGAANFTAAVFDLLRSAERKTPLDNRIRFLANALANVILADLAAHWYGIHPDEWARQQEHGDEPDPDSGLTVRHAIYAQFWLDESTAQRDRAAWLALVDALERKLR